MRLVSPQRVECDNGDIVHVADRYTVKYIGKTSKWRVEVEFCIGITYVSRQSLQLFEGLSAIDADTVLKCIVEGLSLMGVKCEITE